MALTLSSEEVLLLSHMTKPFKLRNIQLSGDGLYEKNITAEVLYQTCNTTDAGRILQDTDDGIKSKRDVKNTLVYFVDKGWQLEESKE